MFTTLGQCYKTFYQGYLLPFYGIDCINNVFNTGWQQYHGMTVNYHVKKFNNIGPCGLYYKNILTILSDDRKWCLYYKCASP